MAGMNVQQDDSNKKDDKVEESKVGEGNSKNKKKKEKKKAKQAEQAESQKKEEETKEHTEITEEERQAAIKEAIAKRNVQKVSNDNK